MLSRTTVKTVITILKIIFVTFITLLKSVTSRYKIIPVSNGMVPFLQLFNSDFRDDTFEVSLSTAETYFVTVLWSETEPERMTELTSNTLRCFLFLLRKVDLSFSIAEAFATDDINSSCVVLLLLRRCLSLAQSSEKELPDQIIIKPDLYHLMFFLDMLLSVDLLQVQCHYQVDHLHVGRLHTSTKLRILNSFSLLAGSSSSSLSKMSSS